MALDTSTVTLSDLQQGSNGRMSFTSTPDFNRNFEWLVGETVTEAIRANLINRGVYRAVTANFLTTAFDTVNIPIVKRPSFKMRAIKEGAIPESGSFGFDEIKMETKEVGTRVKLTDRVLRNIQIDLLAEALREVSATLDIQLTNDAVARLINGNDAAFADAAPIVGVGTPGSFDYDDDWLEIVLGMCELGYRPTTVLGDRRMIKQAMALPEFKGFDGVATKANAMLANMAAPLPSEYGLIPTGAMPASSGSGGQLLFVDGSAALNHYTSKPPSVRELPYLRPTSSRPL